MELILKYFPNLTDDQISKFEALKPLYEDWNSKINVISRKDIENLYINHVLHSLTIAKFIEFKDGSKVLDLGCGGGFPSIPLSIMFPEVDFTAIDGTNKKITVVKEVAKGAGIENIRPLHKRAEEHKGKYDFVVSRAVAKVDKLKMWSEHLIDFNKQQHSLPNGLIALKGGLPKEELGLLRKSDYYETMPLMKLIPEPYYDEKYLLYLQR